MFLSECDSTNTQLKRLLAAGEAPDYIYAGYQTAGRGQTGNGWESERGKNLTCSILLPPEKNLYFLNIAAGVALLRVIGEDFTIKWPNDIYWGDWKVAGILVENAIIGNEIRYSIAGIGLNVNQTEFRSDAPNPISLRQIRGAEYDIHELMQQLLSAMHAVLAEPEPEVWFYYLTHLYRRKGYWPYEDKDGLFRARIEDVLPTGELVLRDEDGKERIYHFKQVRYVI